MKFVLLENPNCEEFVYTSCSQKTRLRFFGYFENGIYHLRVTSKMIDAHECSAFTNVYQLKDFHGNAIEAFLSVFNNIITVYQGCKWRMFKDSLHRMEVLNQRKNKYYYAPIQRPYLFTKSRARAEKLANGGEIIMYPRNSKDMMVYLLSQE